MDTASLEKILAYSPSDTIRTLCAQELRLRDKHPPWHNIHDGNKQALLDFIAKTERGHTRATQKKLRIITKAEPRSAVTCAAKNLSLRTKKPAAKKCLWCKQPMPDQWSYICKPCAENE
jgi:hypothetical protein